VDDVEDALFQTTALTYTPGNRIDWCNNGKVFECIGDAIDQARSSVHVDVFIWKPGQPGDEIARKVIAAAQRGVKVRILVDPMGSPGFKEEVCPSLIAAGCVVRYFRPPRRAPFKLWGRNHRKLVIVDGRVGFTGGFGISREWLGNGESPDHWRESNVRAEGPVVRQMQQCFAAHWMETGGPLLPSAELDCPPEVGSSRAAFVGSMDVKGLSNARWVTHIALAAAQRRLWIANAYFIPPPELLRAVCARGKDGLDLRILLPGSHIDHRWISVLQRSTYKNLGACGVRVFEYQPSMIHAKTMLVDDRLVIVGSTNLDPLSQEFLEEGSLVIDDPQVARSLETAWLEDLSNAREVSLRPPPVETLLMPDVSTDAHSAPAVEQSELG
jgi:cardiolipin synthase A/B